MARMDARRPTLVICRGLPGSGKTTRAREWVGRSPSTRARVNRDDLRAMLHGAYLGHETEQRVLSARDATIGTLLHQGLDVVCDDTNLAQRAARDLAELAARHGAGVQVWDLTDVPLDVCIARDAARPASVGEPVIRDMYARYLAGRRLPLPAVRAPETHAPQRYEPVPGTPRAVLVDIDGTVALMSGRSPYDESRVHEDGPNTAVIAAVRAMHAAGYAVVFCSGRTEASRTATETWLREHVDVPFDALFLRATGDQRRDSVVKTELFDRHIRRAYHVVAVFDDRRQVVAAWRAMGLTVFQVAEGDF